MLTTPQLMGQKKITGEVLRPTNLAGTVNMCQQSFLPLCRSSGKKVATSSHAWTDKKCPMPIERACKKGKYPDLTTQR